MQLLPANSHKKDWIPVGRISASPILEKIKNEEIREIFDADKATPRVSLLLFLCFYPSCTSELIGFSRCFTFFGHNSCINLLMIQRSHAYLPVFNCSVEEEGIGTSISD